MNKISKMISVLIFFLALVVLSGLLMKIPIDMIKQKQEVKVGGLGIEFEDGTTEPEVKAILENSNINANYTIDYNSTTGRGMFYIKVDKNKGYC